MDYMSVTVTEGDIIIGLRVALPDALRSVTVLSDTPALLRNLIVNFATVSPGINRVGLVNFIPKLYSKSRQEVSLACAGHWLNGRNWKW